MRRAADRVAQLTRQLHAHSRRQVLHTEPVELDRQVRESHRMLARLLGPEYPLRLDLDTAGRWVRADRTQLVQVLLNLGINARDAMPGGGPVTISTRYQTPPPARGRLGRDWGNREPVLVLAVSDSGGGIDPAISARIFEPFFTTKPVGGGTGLGLSVVEGIVAQSGGDIWVESAPRVGTTLSLALPEAAPPPLEGNGPEASTPGRGETVLVVDDEAAVRELLARQLTQRGYRVLEAADGAAALELLQGEATHIALVVSDIAMPGMSGTELAKGLRNQGATVPFLFVSGQAREARGEYGDPGEYGPVPEKPFTAEQLAVAVGHALLARAERT
jgi:CheY-like chemotaxis protein